MLFGSQETYLIEILVAIFKLFKKIDLNRKCQDCVYVEWEYWSTM